MWVQVGKHSQHTCPRPYVAGKFVTKPMSYVAALYVYRIKLGTKLIRSLHLLSLIQGGGGVLAGNFRSQPVNFGLFWRNLRAGGLSLSAGTFWPFCVKMYRLCIFYSLPVLFCHFRQKRTRSGLFILCWFILATWGENVPAGNHLMSAGTFWPFWVKMYELRVFYSEPVHFGNLE